MKNELIGRLRELIAALERRVPNLEREGEVRIFHEAAALKQKALARLVQVEACRCPPPVQLCTPMVVTGEYDAR